VRAIIAEQSSETTFIISSRDWAELDRQCRRILLLEKGVLQPETISLDKQQAVTRFITLQMENCSAQEVMTKLKVLEDVIKVTNPQKNEFIVWNITLTFNSTWISN
jgi:ABC-2 type transport system ATP-binding protein